MNSCYKALNINPNIKESWVTLASVHNEKEEYDKTIEACENALKIDPSFDIAIALLGVAFHRKGDLQKAVEHLEKAVELTPNLFKAWFNLAKVYFDLKEFENAREACNICLRHKPELEEAHSLLKEIDKSTHLYLKYNSVIQFSGKSSRHNFFNISIKICNLLISLIEYGYVY